MLRLTSFLIVPTLFAIHQFESVAMAGKWHIRRSQSRCRLPNYSYSDNRPKVSAGLFSGLAIPVADARIGQGDVTTTISRRIEDRTDTQYSVTTSTFRTVRSNIVTIKQKRFMFGNDPLSIDHLRLNRVSAVLSERGELMASGVLSHSASAANDLLRTRVTIHVRALAGTKLDAVPPDNALVIWQMKKSLWIERGKPEYLAIRTSRLRELSTNFDQITHLEILVEYDRSF